MKTRDWVAALSAAAFCVLIDISGTFGQTGAPAAGPPAKAAPVVNKGKAKPPDQSQTTVDVTVVNSRAAGFIELEATESGFPTWKKIAGPLKAGQKAAARVPRGKDCRSICTAPSQTGSPSSPKASRFAPTGRSI